MSIQSKLIQNKSLALLSTFRIGGLAKFFIEVQSIKEMIEVRNYINEQNIPFWVLGRGSNSLFDDRGFDGLVVLNSIRFCEFNQGSLHVGSGYNFSLLGAQMARAGWGGLEFASGIPGSVGGAIFMNAGAGGVETCEILTAVSYVDSQGRLIEKKAKELAFSYRRSLFHKNGGMIVSGRFQLEKCEKAREKQIFITERRIATQPYGQPSVGCIFRNPSFEKSAGALIEQCALKGKQIGEAQVSPLHGNFIVNQGRATAADVGELISFIQKTVQKQTGIKLECEVQMVPYQKRESLR